VFRDVVMLALVGFVAIVIVLLPHLNPPGAKTAHGMAPPGNVIVEVRWPDEIDPTSTFGCRRPVTCRWATRIRVERCSTCSETISAIASA
jgi:hypothetical protein